MTTIYNPPQNMRAIVMHHVEDPTDADLQKMRPLQVYLTNMDDLVSQAVVQSIVGIPFYYAASLVQTDTNGPVATELFNSIDATLAWTRSGEGVYVLAPIGGIPFPQIRTLILASPAGEIGINDTFAASVTDAGASITLRTFSAAVPFDNVIVNGLFFLVMVFNEVS